MDVTGIIIAVVMFLGFVSALAGKVVSWYREHPESPAARIIADVIKTFREEGIGRAAAAVVTVITHGIASPFKAVFYGIIYLSLLIWKGPDNVGPWTEWKAGRARKVQEEEERIAQEEIERIAQKKDERIALKKAKSIAQEKAKRIAQEEAKHKALKEAERIAQKEEERIAHEEAKRIAQELAEQRAQVRAEDLSWEEAVRQRAVKDHESATVGLWLAGLPEPLKTVITRLRGQTVKVVLSDDKKRETLFSVLREYAGIRSGENDKLRDSLPAQEGDPDAPAPQE